MSITDRLDEIEARHAKTTPGVWKIWGMSVMADQVGSGRVNDAVDVALTVMKNEHGSPRTFDAQFISTAHQDVPALVAALRAVLDVCDGLEEAHRANPDQAYEYGLEEAAHQVRNAIEAALGEVAS